MLFLHVPLLLLETPLSFLKDHDSIDYAMVSHVRVAEDSFDIVEHFPLQVHFVVKSFHIFALCNLGRLDSQRLFGARKDSDGVFTTCGRVIPLRKRQNLQTPRLWLLYPRVWRLLV